MKEKVVARFLDGRVLKGTTIDFSPRRDTFNLSVEPPDKRSPVRKISLSDLKAVFFVKSLTGDRHYNERKLQIPAGRAGRQFLVTFRDGELMRGTSIGTQLTTRGFLFFPADPESNNKRIFVVRSAIKDLKEE